MTNGSFQGPCFILASKGLHACLIQFAEKARNGKEHFNVILERRKSAITATILTFSTFFINKNILLYVKIERFNFGCGRVSFTCA